MKNERSDSGKLYVSPEQYMALLEARDKSFGTDMTGVIFTWLERLGYDPFSFCFKETEIVVIW
jgi:hypothetical protein